MIDRRTAIAGLLGALGAPGIAGAQSARAARKIGYLHPTTIAPTHETLVILRRAWQALGYVEGETVLLRSAEGDPARLHSLVAELIGLDVGVLIVVGAGAVRAASRVTTTIPIVAFDLETDPVRAGYAVSVARPGGNVTGLFMDMASLAGKWIELLREAVPTIEHIVLIWDPTTGPDQLDIAIAAARTKGIAASVIERRAPEGYAAAFATLARQNRTGIAELTSPGSNAAFASLAMAAQKFQLPSITFQKVNVISGALLSYGPDRESYLPRAAILADRILRGAKPGELPIEHPTRFELVINLKTAKVLGIELPPSILLRADEVIE